ncbi:MAG: acetoacetate decarboxylase family protein [Nitrospirae bacterium]|nr:acetoacetate decarboxylase family protein [Nitrospirota bacterium]
MRYAVLTPADNPTRYPIMPLYHLESREAMEMHRRLCWELSDAEYYIVVFNPEDRKFVESCVPPPLKPVPRAPLVAIFVQQLTLNGGKGNDSLNRGYFELIVSAMATYRGKLGTYALAILIESDIGAMLGREMFGTAKKCGQFEYQKNGKRFSWKAIRRDITLAEVEGDLVDGEVDPENIRRIMEQPSFHMQQTMAPFGAELPYACAPRLMEMQLGVRRIHRIAACENVRFGFHESPFDPICLFKPREILAATYVNADTGINTVRDLEPLDPVASLPWLFSKFDPF